VVWVWGRNCRGLLGLGNHTRQHVFHRWEAAACGGVPVVAVACGHDFLLALTQAGHVWSCGASDCGQLGHGTLDDLATPTRVAALENITMVTAGLDVAAAVGADGLVWMWASQESALF